MFLVTPENPHHKKQSSETKMAYHMNICINIHICILFTIGVRFEVDISVAKGIVGEPVAA